RDAARRRVRRIEHCAVASNARALSADRQPAAGRPDAAQPTKEPMMMNSPRKILAAAALLAAASPAAHALDLYTSFSQAQIGSKIACGIVNTGTKPIEVSATVQDYFVGSDITGATTCPSSPATLPAGTGCVASTNAAGNVGYCHFTT